MVARPIHHHYPDTRPEALRPSVHGLELRHKAAHGGIIKLHETASWTQLSDDILAGDLFRDATRTLTGEQRLAIGLIELACHELRVGLLPFAQEAHDWVFHVGHCARPLPFETCCDLLHLDVEYLRRGIAKLEQGRALRAPKPPRDRSKDAPVTSGRMLAWRDPEKREARLVKLRATMAAKRAAKEQGH